MVIWSLIIQFFEETLNYFKKRVRFFKNCWLKFSILSEKQTNFMKTSCLSFFALTKIEHDEGNSLRDENGHNFPKNKPLKLHV